MSWWPNTRGGRWNKSKPEPERGADGFWPTGTDSFADLVDRNKSAVDDRAEGAAVDGAAELKG